MAIITPSATFPFGAECGVGQARFDLVSSSDATGAEQARLLGPPKWTLRLVQPSRLTLAEQGQWASLVLRLRGKVNTLACWDPVRTAPLGTLRGTLALSATAAAGATTAALAGGTASGTLKQGDWLQIGTGLGTSQLVLITADATANGSGAVTVAFEPPLRQAFSGSTGVTWDKPVAYYRTAGDGATGWTYGVRGLTATGFALDLVERFA